jgi:hypothetical protein
MKTLKEFLVDKKLMKAGGTGGDPPKSPPKRRGGGGRGPIEVRDDNGKVIGLVHKFRGETDWDAIHHPSNMSWGLIDTPEDGISLVKSHHAEWLRDQKRR